MNPAVQWMTLIYMILAGSAMGVAYDSYRVLSLKLSFPKWLNALLDLLYWIWAALLVFRMLYAGNQGQLRFYVFLGLFLGVWIYFLIFSVTVRRFVVMLIQSVQYTCRLLWRALEILIGVPLRWLWRLCKGTLLLLGRILLFILKLLLRLTKPIWVFPVRWISPYVSRLGQSAWIKRSIEWITAWRKR
ncbi:spore cortex biosynthesis protein YabQ [Paenibacillus sp. FSL R7-0331]|uniref:spore cortex biosynthesis protein YabQ n=1 Tax=Paenibacillus sp. FSL R7-0331 TaxID=1536773 RepID=UPI0004F6D5EC|nr:spore cortex biosynthesis protein YabQ [Paenibacillus sp. FSL R7-0331]AIQ50140.1 spore cortex biosynthesis protein YabQ [Paenibacillus sp. FSL R7-0331]